MSRASGLTNVDRQVVTFYWWVLENNSLSSEKSPLVAGIFHPLGSQGPISLLGILCKENLPRCSTEPRILKLPFPLLSKASSMVGNVNLFGKMFSDTKPAGCHVWLCCCVTCTWSQVGSSRCCGVLSSLCSPVCIVRSEVTSLTAHLQAWLWANRNSGCARNRMHSGQGFITQWTGQQKKEHLLAELCCAHRLTPKAVSFLTADPSEYNWWGRKGTGFCGLRES